MKCGLHSDKRSCLYYFACICSCGRHQSYYAWTRRRVTARRRATYTASALYCRRLCTGAYPSSWMTSHLKVQYLVMLVFPSSLREQDSETLIIQMVLQETQGTVPQANPSSSMRHHAVIPVVTFVPIPKHCAHPNATSEVISSVAWTLTNALVFLSLMTSLTPYTYPYPRISYENLLPYHTKPTSFAQLH